MAKVGEGPAAQRYKKMKAVDRAQDARARAKSAASRAQKAADKAESRAPKGFLTRLVGKRKRALDKT